ncbi:MAG: heparan-alpha-glucosaminide N-acetyltransferase domain-containing protein [Vicinamibacteria bacterium]
MPANRSRLTSIDALRGLVMVIMALDHVRDFFHVGAMSFQPDDLTKTTAPLFFTRWITHICAPVFMFTTGIGAFLWAGRPGRTKADLSRYLISRGLWLIFLELTILRFSFFFSLRSSPWMLTVLWALGASMVALGFLVHLPTRVLGVLSLATIAAHNLFDGVPSPQFGEWAPLWTILHEPGVIMAGKTVWLVAYPLIPWIAVMSAGYCAGGLLRADAETRRRWLIRLGIGMTSLFFILRGLNVYGDPRPWSDSIPGTVLMSFLRTQKYPPSLLFLLMTLGPALLLLAWFDHRDLPRNHPLVIIGRVPLFFFLLHFLLAHLLWFPLAFALYGDVAFLLGPMPSMGGAADTYPAGFGLSLGAVYAVWLTVLALSYPLCRWFAGVKERQTDWWLSYL